MSRVTVSFERCKGCGLCVSVCPEKILVPSESINRKGIHPIEPRGPEKCRLCRLCVIMCPDVAINLRK
jgi:2-oxoglutarate ferredoxin oxidoreductase subunit delta